MSGNVKSHPHRELLEEAAREREVADGPEGQPLQEAIINAVNAYSDFLERNNLIWDGEADPLLPRLKGQSLVVTLDFGKCGDIDITLKDGALDRVYGNGINADPEGRGPSDIPHQWRHED